MDEINKSTNEKPTIRYMAGKPSLYITRKKEKYTNARPVSFCAMDNAAGPNVNAKAMRCDRRLLNSVSCRLKYFANANAVNTLDNSAGCRLKPPPNAIHDFEPLISLPIT